MMSRSTHSRVSSETLRSALTIQLCSSPAVRMYTIPAPARLPTMKRSPGWLPP